MAHCGEDHGQAGGIGRLYDLIVPDGAAGLDDCLDACLGRELDIVGEGEEGVGGQDAAAGLVAGGALDRWTLTTRLGWPAPMPTRARSLAKTMALDLMCLAAFQAKARSWSWCLVGRRLVTVFQVDGSSPMSIGVLNQQAAADGPQVIRGGPVGLFYCEDSEIALLLKGFQGLGIVVRGDYYFVEHRTHCLGRGEGNRAVEADDAAERGDGVAFVSEAVGLGLVAVASKATGLPCLTTATVESSKSLTVRQTASASIRLL